MTLLSTKERARGQWRFILPKFGIDAKYLAGRNCPCPMCGGTDRFRFIDRRGRDGDGMWVCNQCTPRPRPAIDLLIAFTGKPFREAAREVDAILATDAAQLTRSLPRSLDDGKFDSTEYPKKVWARGARVQRGDAVDRWLRSRGVGMDIYPSSLRTCALDWYRDFGSNAMSRHPAMFALICGPDGTPRALQRTYLSPDGQAKAAVPKPRKVAGRYGKGPTIRLAPVATVLGIAEGVETALGAARLFGIPTWSVLCAGGVESFEPPIGVNRLVIFADNDANGTGQRAAHALATRLADRLTVEVKLPEQPGSDWNDILRGRRG